MRKGKDWGIDGYNLPKKVVMDRVNDVIKWDSKSVGVRYLDQIMKRSKSIPDLAKYCKLNDWSRMNKTGKFTSTKRVTYIDKILKQKK